MFLLIHFRNIVGPNQATGNRTYKLNAQSTYAHSLLEFYICTVFQIPYKASTTAICEPVSFAVDYF